MIEMVIDIWIYMIQRHVIVKHDCNIHLCDHLIITNICIFIFEHYMFICIDSPEDPETRKKIFAAAPGCPNLLKGTEVVHFRSF